MQHRVPFPQPPYKPFIPPQRNPITTYKPNPFNPSPFNNQFRNHTNPLTFNFPRQQYLNSHPFNLPQQQRPIQNAFAPRFAPQPKPVPMEVDPSIRTNKINYMNRPNYHIEHDTYSYEDNYDNCYYYPEFEIYDNYQPAECIPNEHAVETPEPAAGKDPEPKQSEPAQIDDLNFQLADGPSNLT